MKGCGWKCVVLVQMCFCLGKELAEDKWEEISDKMLHAALMESSRLSSVYKGEQVCLFAGLAFLGSA